MEPDSFRFSARLTLTALLDFPNVIGLNSSNYVSQTIHKSCFWATVHHAMMQLRGFGYDDNCPESPALFVGCSVATGKQAADWKPSWMFTTDS